VAQAAGLQSTGFPACIKRCVLAVISRRQHMKSSLTTLVARWGAGAALAAAACGALAQAEPPKYGGTLEVATPSTGVTTLTWDLADWQASLQTRDTGQFYEQLFSVDMNQAKGHGGPYGFNYAGAAPEGTLVGELAQTWEWSGPLTLVVNLRHGVKFPAKPGVMAEREFVADDVVFTFNRLRASPKNLPGYLDYIDKVEARDAHTLVFHFNAYLADWDYRWGNGWYSGIYPREVVDAPNGGASNWKNVNGTGPFMLADVVTGSQLTFAKNPIYWGTETIAGKEYKLPYVDKLVHRVLKDPASQKAALRTGKIDILSAMSWEDAEELKKTTPQLKWNRYLSSAGNRITLRVDKKPFTDARVRRALNMAVNKQEIIDKFYGGNAEMFTFPMHPDFVGYHKPLKDQPASVQELYQYDPDKARKLLAEAGYPDGFSFNVQVCGCNSTHMELMPLIAAYLQAVKVDMKIVPMEYAAFVQTMVKRANAEGYMNSTPDNSPMASLRVNFGKTQFYNSGMWDDPAFDAAVAAANSERDDKKRQKMLQDLTTQILDAAPAIWLPNSYGYAAWWPWVKNYGGEHYVSATRGAPFYARIWIDQELKKKMGF
jgi:peptide/nickel transport system substrate-binding protein